MKRIGAILMALVLLAGCLLGFAACGQQAAALGDVQISESLYNYWFACYKYEYLAAYKLKDTAATWESVTEDGRTLGEVLTERIRADIGRRMAAASLFRRWNYTLSEAEKEAILACVEDLFVFGGEDEKRALLEKWQVTEAELRKLAVYEWQYRALKMLLYGNSDIETLYTSQDASVILALEEYYQTRCRRIRVIYVSKDKTEAIAALDAEMDGITEDRFAFLEETYTELDTVKEYPDGIYLLDDAAYDGADPVFALAARAQMGKTLRQETEKGVYYLYRGQLGSKAYIDDRYKTQFSQFAACFLASQYQETLAEEMKKLTYPGAALPEVITARSNADCNIVEMVGGRYQ